MLHSFTNPTNYAKNANIQKTLALEALQSIRFTGRELVYDIGCGDGQLTLEIAKKLPNGHIVGIDVSEQMISFANDHNSAQNASFDCVDVTQFRPNKKADGIVSFNALHWVPDQETALANVKMALMENGFISFIVFSPLKEQELLYNNILSVMNEPHWVEFFKDFREIQQMTVPNLQAYQELLESNGFEPVRCVVGEKTFQFSSKEIVVNDLCAWLPQAKHLEEALRANFVTEVVDKILMMTGQSQAIRGGDVTMKVFPWIIEAKVPKLKHDNDSRASNNVSKLT